MYAYIQWLMLIQSKDKNAQAYNDEYSVGTTH